MRMQGRPWYLLALICLIIPSSQQNYARLSQSGQRATHHNPLSDFNIEDAINKRKLTEDIKYYEGSWPDSSTSGNDIMDPVYPLQEEGGANDLASSGDEINYIRLAKRPSYLRLAKRADYSKMEKRPSYLRLAKRGTAYGLLYQNPSQIPQGANPMED